MINYLIRDFIVIIIISFPPGSPKFGPMVIMETMKPKEKGLGRLIIGIVEKI